MRSIVSALALTLLTVLFSGVLLPIASTAHAQSSSFAVMTTPSTVIAGSTATVSGTGFTPGCYAFVYWVRPDGTTGSTFAFAGPAGTFSMALGFSATHGTGNEFVTAYDYCAARWAPYSLVIVRSATPASLPTLTPSAMTVTAGAAVTAANSVTVTGAGFTSNSYVYAQWTRPNGTMGSLYVFTDGTGGFTFTLGFLQSNGCGTAAQPKVETVRAYDFGMAAWTNPLNITATCP